MKNLLKISLLALLTLGFFSCSNEEAEIAIPEQSATISPSLKTSLVNYTNTTATTNQDSTFFSNNDGCYTLAFPVSVTSDGGVTVTAINSEIEFINYIANLNPGAGFEYIFPVNTTLAGNTVTFNNEVELNDALDSCIEVGDNPMAPCFTLNFPLELETGDGQTVTVNNIDEYANVDVIDANGFVYPISVTLADGSVVTVNNDSEFDTLYNDCFNIDACNDCIPNCFEIVYPMNLISETGEVITVNNDEELDNFFDTNPNENSFFLTYPINLELEDGSQTAVNDDAEFEEAFANCI